VATEVQLSSCSEPEQLIEIQDFGDYPYDYGIGGRDKAKPR
jgi:hypothetical protein